MYLKIFFYFLIILVFEGCYTFEQTIPLPKEYQTNKKESKIKYTNQSNTYTISQTGFYSPNYKTSPSTNKSQTQKKHNAKNFIYKKELKFKGSGYIKGIVNKIIYQKKHKRWIYDISGKETSHGKLSKAIVYATKKLAKPNDLVYATIKNGYIISLYIYGHSKLYNIGKKMDTKKIKKIKKDKKHHRIQLIKAPREEKILF